jgi:hypothetical protein
VLARPFGRMSPPDNCHSVWKPSANGCLDNVGPEESERDRDCEYRKHCSPRRMQCAEGQYDEPVMSSSSHGLSKSQRSPLRGDRISRPETTRPDCPPTPELVSVGTLAPTAQPASSGLLAQSGKSPGSKECVVADAVTIEPVSARNSLLLGGKQGISVDLSRFRQF